MTIEDDRTDDLRRALADALRAYARREDITLKVVGERLGISEQYVHKLVAGRGWPSPEILARLRQLRAVDINALLDGVIESEAA